MDYVPLLVLEICNCWQWASLLELVPESSCLVDFQQRPFHSGQGLLLSLL